MSGSGDFARKVAELTGMRSKGKWVFGRFEGHLCAAEIGNEYEGTLFPSTVWFRVAPGAVPPLRDALREKERLKAAGLLPKWLKLYPFDFLLKHTVIHVKGGPQTPEQFAARVGALAAVVKRGGPGVPETCADCNAEGAQPMVVLQRPVQLCKACLGKRAAGFKAKAEAPKTQPANLPKGLAYGALTMLICSFFWGLVGALAGQQFEIMAALFGYLIAYAFAKGSGSINGAVAAGVVALTLFSVLFGLVLIVVLYNAFHPGFSLYPGQSIGYALSRKPLSVLFAVGAAAFGAYVGVKQLSEIKEEAPERFEAVW